MKHVKMFQPRFAPLVEAGSKCQTVRPWPKRECNIPKQGDPISLRTWGGKPYRSKQRVLREAVVTRVADIYCDAEGIDIACRRLEPWDADDFALADGFDGWVGMCEWIRTTHGLPFRGMLIEWREVAS